MEYKIEKNIPPPDTGKHVKQKYPFDAMEVGDSVFIPDVKIAKIGGNLLYRRPKKFTCITIDGGVRVWRIV